MLKNSLTLAVSVPINIFIKFAFVSVNGTREYYFADELSKKIYLLKLSMKKSCRPIKSQSKLS